MKRTISEDKVVAVGAGEAGPAVPEAARRPLRELMDDRASHVPKAMAQQRTSVRRLPSSLVQEEPVMHPADKAELTFSMPRIRR